MFSIGCHGWAAWRKPPGAPLQRLHRRPRAWIRHDFFVVGGKFGEKTHNPFVLENSGGLDCYHFA